MLAKKELEEQARRLTDHAIEKYGELKNRKPRPPLDQLVMSVFCHRTSIGQGTRALRKLKRLFVDWNEVRVSHPVELTLQLPSTRWAETGAEQVVWLLREMYDRYSRIDLGFLDDLTPAQARSCLQSFPMVARDIADEVLLLSFQVPVLPLGSDTARMSWRLGLLENDRPTLKNQRALSKLFHEEYYPSVHFFFNDHAENPCSADEPDCGQCPLEVHCPCAG